MTSDKPLPADKQLRMDVYREGQIAYRAETLCPYTDWRAGTWNKGYLAAKAHYEEMSKQEQE